MFKRTFIATTLLVASTIASAAPSTFTFSPSLMHAMDGMNVPLGSSAVQGVSVGKRLLAQVPDCLDPATYHPEKHGACFYHATGADGALVIGAPGVVADALPAGADPHALGYRAPTVVDTTYFDAGQRYPKPVHVVITSLPPADRTAQDLVASMMERFGPPTSVSPNAVTWSYQDIGATVVYAPANAVLNVPSAGTARVLYAAVYDARDSAKAKQLVEEYSNDLFAQPAAK